MWLARSPASICRCQKQGAMSTAEIHKIAHLFLRTNVHAFDSSFVPLVILALANPTRLLRKSAAPFYSFRYLRQRGSVVRRTLPDSTKLFMGHSEGLFECGALEIGLPPGLPGKLILAQLFQAVT